MRILHYSSSNGLNSSEGVLSYSADKKKGPNDGAFPYITEA